MLLVESLARRRTAGEKGGHQKEGGQTRPPSSAGPPRAGLERNQWIIVQEFRSVKRFGGSRSFAPADDEPDDPLDLLVEGERCGVDDNRVRRPAQRRGEIGRASCRGRGGR